MKVATFAQDAVRAYRNTIYRIALAQTKQPDVAEDITQETFIALFETGPDRFLTREHAKEVCMFQGDKPAHSQGVKAADPQGDKAACSQRDKPARSQDDKTMRPHGEINELYLKAWLIRTCINRCKDYFRRTQYQVPQSDFEHILSSSNQTQSTRGALKDVLAYIDTLPNDQKLVIHLICIEGYSSKEVAAILEKPEGTVRSLLHYARKKLKEHLASTTSQDADQIRL